MLNMAQNQLPGIQEVIFSLYLHQRLVTTLLTGKAQQMVSKNTLLPCMIFLLQ